MKGIPCSLGNFRKGWSPFASAADEDGRSVCVQMIKKREKKCISLVPWRLRMVIHGEATGGKSRLH
jgi:hypothetical protein